MEDSAVLILVDIDGTITTILEPRIGYIWISLCGNHFNTVFTWTCVTRLNLG